MTRPVVPIALIDHTGTISASEISKVAHALERQVNEHFALAPPFGYGIGAKVRAASNHSPPKTEEWACGLFADADQPGALGYHDVSPAGSPLIKIFPLLDKEDGSEWSVTASHEVLETLADPMICRGAQAQDGKWWALEVGDAVENQTYKIGDVSVSDFVLPPYFEPPQNIGSLKLDFLGQVSRPLEILSGGYGQYWTGTKWQQVYGPDVRSARRVLRHFAGRGARRKLSQAPYEYDAKVVRVLDGDTVVFQLAKTFSLDVDFGFNILDSVSLAKVAEQRFAIAKIKANGTDVMSKDGLQSQAELTRLLGLGPIHVVSHGQDPRGRWIGSVTVADPKSGSVLDVGLEMVRGGFAEPWNNATDRSMLEAP